MQIRKGLRKLDGLSVQLRNPGRLKQRTNRHVKTDWDVWSRITALNDIAHEMCANYTNNRVLPSQLNIYNSVSINNKCIKLNKVIITIVSKLTELIHYSFYTSFFLFSLNFICALCTGFRLVSSSD